MFIFDSNEVFFHNEVAGMGDKLVWVQLNLVLHYLR